MHGHGQYPLEPQNYVITYRNLPDVRRCLSSYTQNNNQPGRGLARLPEALDIVAAELEHYEHIFPAVETTKHMLRLADSRAPDDTTDTDTVAHPDVAGVHYCNRGPNQSNMHMNLSSRAQHM